MGSSRRTANIATAVSAMLRGLPIGVPLAFIVVPAAASEAFRPAALVADIPAQPLAKALESVARQTGLQLLYVSGVVGDQKSRAASAGLNANEALARVLRGTGLQFEYLTPRSVRILTMAVGQPQGALEKGLPAEELQEVIVSANRREENLQNVPITIQVLTGDTLARLNVTTFDDVLKYLPAVTAHGVGPGQNNIYVRGLGAADAGSQGSGWGGVYPNVAVYLDEQSGQLPGRNLDVYAADLARIEVLEGPQGTLFGAGAEAGVLRYITNKPKLDVTEAAVNAGYATTSHGDPSSNLDATLNVPLIAGTLAARAVIYDEKRGGYINNIAANFARAPTDAFISNFFGGQIPANSVVINNGSEVANAINPVSYSGARLELLYRFDENWSALLAESYQNMQAEGVFAEMSANSLGQPLPDLSVQLFNPSHDNDKFENTALTIEGRIGAMKLLYAGAYLVRNVDQIQDYTSYARGLYADYYECGGRTSASIECFTPSSTWRDRERNTHQSHELRLSTPGDWRARAIGGLFYEDYRIQDQVDFNYLTALPYFHAIGPPTGYYTLNGSTVQPNGKPVTYSTQGAIFVFDPATSNDPSVRSPEVAFLNDITRGYAQKAAYASMDYDLVPERLTLTAGSRYFRTDTTEVGSEVGAGGCQLVFNPTAPDPCVNRSDFTNLNAEGLDRAYSGFRSRANLSWKVTDAALLYYTWSQGYRVGGFNRAPFAAEANSPLASNGEPSQAQAGKHGGWVAPLAFGPDSLTNNELGWKTLWMDRSVQWNGAIYQENWNNAQIEVGAHGVISYGVIINGGDYRVRGIESSLEARVTRGLTLEAGAAWNHSELVRQATFLWADGTPIDFNALPISNPSGALGSSLAGAPPFQGNIRARYEFVLGDDEAFAQLGAMHQSHSLATTDRLSLDLQGNSIAYELPEFTTFDAALGLQKDAWTVQAYGENLADTRAQLYANYQQWYKAVTVSRPRTVGVRFSYKFSGP